MNMHRFKFQDQESKYLKEMNYFIDDMILESRTYYSFCRQISIFINILTIKFHKKKPIYEQLSHSIGI